MFKDKKHLAQIDKKYLNDSKFRVLVYPAQRPDLNLIENFWVYLKKKT